jgi:predicted dehydrogenase
VEGELRLAIISARTADNPALLKACVAVGCTAIYLEKPGATTVEDLEAMRDLTVSKGVAVHMGFNKNVSGYLTKSREFAKNYDGPADVTFLHNNNYPNTTEALSECFERNAEGMLKNMAIHELAICVTYYGVTVDTIASVEADKEYSSLKTLGGFTDFDKLKFKITTKAGVSISVAADRCGGDDSVGIVTDAASGAELARFSMPDDETVAKIPALKEKYGDAMPYFFTQDPDYLELKNRVVQSVVHGKDPDGVADIGVAIETLKVAEYLTPILQEELK